MSMTAAEIAEERRRSRLAGAAAITSAVLVLAAWVLALVVNRDAPSGDRGLLRHFDEHAPELLATSAAKALGVLLLVAAVPLIFAATRARKNDLSQVSLIMGMAGAVLYALGAIASAIAVATIASDFVSSGRQTGERADDLLNDPSLLLIGAFASAGALALGFWFVMASLNAMRVGLVTRLMGVVGILLGPMLVLLPSRITDPVLVSWLGALGVLLLGYWPGGRPPAWERGEAVPWQSAREEAEESIASVDQAGGSRNGDVEPVGPGVRKPEEESARSGGGRRKRKRRR
jgi:hypothetical protein